MPHSPGMKQCEACRGRTGICLAPHRLAAAESCRTTERHAQAEVFRWWRLWERDVRQGWLIIARFRVSFGLPPALCGCHTGMLRVDYSAPDMQTG